MAEANIALFIDFENLAIGIRQSRYDKFDVDLLLKRLLEKGRILFKRAYCDWSKFRQEKKELHEAAIELFDIPQRSRTGKNSADIRMVVDALDLCYTRPHLQMFVIASGDSDFSPLVSKLREYDKTVIGVGVKTSTSELLVYNCDEFIFYEDLMRGRRDEESHYLALPKKKREVFNLLEDAVVALQRENRDIMWSSVVKQMMQRLKPTFDMQYFGYKNFSDLLRDAEKHQVVSIERDHRSGSYIVVDLGDYEP
ncbi:MAG: NYN domain-containing protein [Armatimonadetes bacterium]|nr:NYN domain-containing protein [Armatimonadota bacterium]